MSDNEWMTFEQLPIGAEFEIHPDDAQMMGIFAADPSCERRVKTDPHNYPAPSRAFTWRQCRSGSPSARCSAGSGFLEFVSLSLRFVRRRHPAGVGPRWVTGPGTSTTRARSSADSRTSSIRRARVRGTGEASVEGWARDGGRHAVGR